MAKFRRLNKTLWTKGQDDTLRKQFLSGMNIKEISKLQQRTINAIQNRIRVLNYHNLSHEKSMIEPYTSQMETFEFQTISNSNEVKENEIKQMEDTDESQQMEHENKFITIFDTETTGKLKDEDKKCLPSDLKAYEFVRILQFAYECYTQDGTFVKKECFYIKPTYEEFDYKEALQIHGISREMVLEKGIEHSEFIQRVKRLIDETSLFVAHNILFDSSIIESEWYRDPWGKLHASEWKSVKKECTLLMSRNILKFDPDSNYKLATVHSRLGLHKSEGIVLHQADSDTKMCTDIYFHIRGRLSNRIYLNVPFHDVNVVKLLGGVFDVIKKKWFVYENCHWKKYLLKWFR